MRNSAFDSYIKKCDKAIINAQNIKDSILKLKDFLPTLDLKINYFKMTGNMQNIPAIAFRLDFPSHAEGDYSYIHVTSFCNNTKFKIEYTSYEMRQLSGDGYRNYFPIKEDFRKAVSDKGISFETLKKWLQTRFNKDMTVHEVELTYKELIKEVKFEKDF